MPSWEDSPATPTSSVSPTPRSPMNKRTVALMLLVAVSVCAAPASAKLGPNPTNRRLATELLRILQAKDYKALRAFLSPAFLLQRQDGTFLTKQQYLDKPAVVLSYKATDIHGTRTGDVRVVRF